MASVLLFAMLVPGLALDAEKPTTVLHLRSDLDGVRPEEYTRFAEIESGVLDFNTVTRTDPVYVSDYAGTALSDTDEMKAGREYVVYCDLFPVNGFVLPETKEELDVQFDCGKGVRVITWNVTRGGKDGLRVVNVMAAVKVDGNLFQRIIGWIYDRYLKLRAWSLY